MTDLTTSSLGTLSEVSTGDFLLEGVLDYRNGKQLSVLGRQKIQNSAAQTLTLDCSGVTRTSSVGMALILSFIREAEACGKKLTIKTLTTDLDEIAKFSGVLELLPLDKSFEVIIK